MTDNTLSGSLTNITNFIAAAGGLGTAAYGLVDASKAIAGGMSNPGFGYVKKAVEPFLVDTKPGGVSASGFGKAEMVDTLRANWLNGVTKAEQKAVAKALIRLGINSSSAPQLAGAAGVDPAHLVKVAQLIGTGESLSAEDQNLLGRFDAIVSAAIDRGYERADQFYRNWAKVAAGLVAIVLAVIGGGLLHQGHLQSDQSFDFGDYIGSTDFYLALLVGIISTPLAPIAKDVTTTLAAAVSAVGAARRGKL